MKIRCIDHNQIMESNSSEAKKHISCKWDFDPDGESK